jgi:hypothetical protein
MKAQQSGLNQRSERNELPMMRILPIQWISPWNDSSAVMEAAFRHLQDNPRKSKRDSAISQKVDVHFT